SVAVFTVEYFLRIWCAVDSEKYADSEMGPLKTRLRFISSPYAIIDFLAILPFYLLLGGLFGDIDMRFLRCIRLLRILKLTRYSSAFDMLVTTCRENTRPLTAAFFILATVMLLAASGTYFFERHAQPVAFGSIPDAMWWAVSTLTTVGYGDVTPITTGGKIFGAIITVLGIGMVALPTGILASGYSTQSRLRSQKYWQEANQALGDGIISQHESSQLERLRVGLSLGKHTASQILDEERARQAIVHNSERSTCPHCGASLTSD
ncbi:MAG: ion transporter, partial [Woeseiaceae bacterium]